MRIAVLGAGAMGSLFGGLLSQRNDVWLIDINGERVRRINREGVILHENGRTLVFHPQAATEAASLGAMDLVIVFVKAMHTEAALSANQSLLSPNTLLMTLQNGAGHTQKLLQYAEGCRIAVGVTQHNASLNGDGSVHHGGGGETAIGPYEGDGGRLAPVAQAFTGCGIQTSVSGEIWPLIWKKLFLNTAASSLTAILQVPLGFILDNPWARSMMRALAREAVAAANAEGAGAFDAEAEIRAIEAVLRNARSGYTSIYADIKRDARSEVDTISGAVVASAKRTGVETPCHEMVVALIHALEDKAETEREGRA